jgi:enoyl-CoA hydratase/carnithine racemase
MDFAHLRLVFSDWYAIITLDRPKVNALSAELLANVAHALDTCNSREGVRAIVITGGDSKFFCGGADIPTLKESLDAPFAPGAPLATGLDLMDRIASSTIPVIAAVNGFALGGGCELAMACHIRIASESAIFGQPEINLGIVPGWGGCHRLPRLIGESRALEWLLTGRMVSAQEAMEAGLVSKIVPGEDLAESAREMAETLAGKPPVAVRAILRAVHESALHPEAGKSLESEAFTETAASADAREGISAFMEKRSPKFRGN